MPAQFNYDLPITQNSPGRKIAERTGESWTPVWTSTAQAKGTMRRGMARNVMNGNDAEHVARIANARVSRIADLTEAIDACIVGTVRASKILLGPGSGLACVAYRFRDSQGRTEHRAVPFVVEDETGHAMIQVSTPTLLVTVHDGDGADRSLVGAGYLRHHRHPGPHREQRVEIGQQIVVLGPCTREPDRGTLASFLYRDRPASLIRFAQRADTPIVLAEQIAVDPTAIWS